jgi:hypothetical protein
VPKYKQPNAPKFEPVIIASYRPAVRSLLTSDADREKMLGEDSVRIAAERLTAALNRLKALQKYLGLAGDFGDVTSLMKLLLAVANRYVPGFEVKVDAKGPKRQSGPPKKAERFMIVTMVEGRAASQSIPIKEAIRILSASKINGRTLAADSLTTKYYGAMREIERHPHGAALLKLWRIGLPNDLSEEMAPLFWSFENENLNAVSPHNVRQFPLRK